VADPGPPAVAAGVEARPGLWRDAQGREQSYWTGRCRDPIGVLYEVGEHLDLAWRLQAHLAAEPRSVLDVGVGPMGTGLLWLFARSGLRVGVDSLGLLPVATGNPHADGLVRGIRAECRYVIGKAEALAFPDGRFDVVVCNNVLDHVEDAHRSVAELCRVVRRGGVLGLSVDTNSCLGYWLRRIDRWRRPHLNAYRLHPTDLVIGEVERALTGRGFRIVSSNAASRLGWLVGRRRMQSWVAVRED
jgi:SAM-dependent methyltransferase